MQYWYLAASSVLCAGILAYAESKRKLWTATVFKALGSILFVLLGFLCWNTGAKSLEKGILILIGLILGAVGDVFLNLKHQFHESQVMFLIGGFSFFFGHILYLIVMVPLAGSAGTWGAIGAIIVAVCIVSMLFAKFKVDTKLRILMTGYMATVTLMAGTAVAGMFHNGFALPFVFRAIGGVLFVISDTLLFIRMLKDEGSNFGLCFALLLTYYPAQCLIAMSLFY